MLGSAMIETVIGLSLFFLMLSLLVTGLLEFVATITKLRAFFLRRGVRNLLYTGKDGAAAHQYSRQIMNHALIKQTNTNILSKLLYVGPSYIQPRTFRIAFIDILCQACQVKNDANFPVNIQAAIQDKNNDLYNTPLGSAVIALINAAENKLEKFYQEVETWYNRGMDRVSEWYKRFTQVTLFAIGIILAFVVNIDTIQITSSLYNNAENRQIMTSMAENYVQNVKTTDEGQPEFDIKEISEVINNFKSLTALPIGWTGDPAWKGWLAFFGWLGTALAVTLGAPFWFDILKRFINLRGAERKPGTTTADT